MAAGPAFTSDVQIADPQNAKAKAGVSGEAGKGAVGVRDRDLAEEIVALREVLCDLRDLLVELTR